MQFRLALLALLPLFAAAFRPMTAPLVRAQALEGRGDKRTTKGKRFIHSNGSVCPPCIRTYSAASLPARFWDLERTA